MAVTDDGVTNTRTRERAESATDRLPRPQIYVHFEFGVTCSKTRPANRRSFTYASKQWQEQANLQQSAPEPSPGLLAPAPILEARRTISEPRQTASNTNPRRPVLQALPSTYTAQPSHSPDYLAFQAVPLQPASRRSSRNGSRGPCSHERGSSAPPPWNNSPWNEEPEPLGSSALPTPRHADVWKTLPPLPTTYRLSEQFADDPAWAPFTWPEELGFPDAHPEEEQPSRTRTLAVDPRSVEDPEPRNELARLGTAMATIDNGFEGQWWYQGEREAIARQLETGEIVTPPQEYARQQAAQQYPYAYEPQATTSLPSSPMEVRYTAWSGTRRPVAQGFNTLVSPDVGPDSPSRTRATYDTSTISPITPSDTTSPRPSMLDRVRTMPARTDELFMSV